MFGYFDWRSTTAAVAASVFFLVPPALPRACQSVPPVNSTSPPAKAGDASASAIAECPRRRPFVPPLGRACAGRARASLYRRRQHSKCCSGLCTLDRFSCCDECTSLATTCHVMHVVLLCHSEVCTTSLLSTCVMQVPDVVRYVGKGQRTTPKTTALTHSTVKGFVSKPRRACTALAVNCEITRAGFTHIAKMHRQLHSEPRLRTQKSASRCMSKCSHKASNKSTHCSSNTLSPTISGSLLLRILDCGPQGGCSVRDV